MGMDGRGECGSRGTGLWVFAGIWWGNRIMAMRADRKNMLLEKKGIVVICYLFAGESECPHSGTE